MHGEVQEAMEVIERLRDEGARVHSITNTVAQNFTANVLLACGAIPSMTVNPEEVEVFTRRADCLHVNLGTLDADRIIAIQKSINLATELNKPVLLDPVMANVSPLRAKLAKELIGKIDILRGNSEEISAIDLGESHDCCIIQTGEKDLVLMGEMSLSISNGHPMMAKVIATGCALGALISALSAKSNSPSIAGLAGLIWFGVAGEMAAKKASGPGSFSPAFLDCLYAVTLDELREKARVE